jgi:hypothetical protein
MGKLRDFGQPAARPNRQILYDPAPFVVAFFQMQLAGLRLRAYSFPAPPISVIAF